MERCPNCGAPARPGAKFCTTCGYRLPVTIPVTDQPETSGQASSAAAASWPPPPQRDDPAASDQSDATASSRDPAEDPDSETSFTIPVTDGDTDEPAEQSDDLSATVTETETVSVSDSSSDQSTSTDSVVSSTWTAASPSSTSSAWGTAHSDASLSDEAASDGDSVVETVIDDVSMEQIDESSDAATIAAVTEESIVVDEPASQYEGWSAAVVEELAPPSADHGTNVARATALLDELRLLLPVLNSGGGSGTSEDAGERVAGELETALAADSESGNERQALRAALSDARNNPRDIQTILGVAQQADAAIALLDDYDRLAGAVRHAIHALRPSPQPGIYPSQD